MFEFEIPEELSSFSLEDLQDCMTEAKKEFFALNASDDLSDDVLDRMTELADAIEAMHAQIQATGKREQLSNRMKRIELAGKAFPGAALPFGKKKDKKDDDEDDKDKKKKADPKA